MSDAENEELSNGVVHDVPADLRATLTCSSKARDAWEDITPLARNEFICWIDPVLGLVLCNYRSHYQKRCYIRQKAEREHRRHRRAGNRSRKRAGAQLRVRRYGNSHRSRCAARSRSCIPRSR